MGDELTTIDLAALDDVSGGRYVKGPDQVDPKLIQGISQLAEAIKAVGQAKIASQDQKQGQMMQMFQQMMGKKA
jgi:hypothetical protein